jgi:ubiquinone biosynthesis monooxygenase Coq7
MDSVDTTSCRTTLGDRVMKVNHAGENGAIHIYTGQIFMARIRAPTLVAELCEFRAHEERHRDIFAAELGRRGVRRCRSYWLCGAGGLVLGTLTGLFGSKAIAATTVAVERVVLGHLRQQLLTLAGNDDQATAAISKIVDEEQQHFDQSASHLSAAGFWPRLLSPVVAVATESVIWMGMRL